MLKHSDDNQPGEHPDIGRLLARLARESGDWVEAEAALARIELAELRKQLVRRVALAGSAVAAGLCMLLALTQAMIAVLVGVMVHPAWAALLSAGVFGVLALCLAAASRRQMAWPAESIFLRWLRSGSRDSDVP